MNDVHTTVARKLRSAAAALRADAAASNFVNLRDALLTEIVELEKRADTLEEQAAVEEPMAWGSIVRARIGIEAPVLLTYVPEPEAVRDNKYSWYSDRDSWHSWADLDVVEVLRVGVGDEDAYNKGVSDTVSALVARLMEKRSVAVRRGVPLWAYNEAIKIAEAL